ncbi:YegP family protein [Hydrogenophaga sp. PBL-H3]|uniref:YegP family protein n=1 Tax=Hydrogenophaga sp. PBL-H3 TaxID=434010 RepID=UPI00131F56B6|nr:YegP family protein [Hydrogenophaga sp. PBL-H3]QHE74658.1 YegP family protein [Hydrogenophaga sp. PBL-H3]QHE79083.1 YegP family protein [Hydrogenophaga sp. PBL-H3]
MAGWYELNRNDKGQYSFALKEANGEVVLRSELYETRAGADNGIASVQKNSTNESAYTHSDASDGRFYFNLKAANHQIIGTSQMYKTAAARRAGMESVRTHGPSTVVKTGD